MGKPEPSRLAVHKTLREIIQHASKLAQYDYKNSLGEVELRFLTSIYVRRAADMLEDEEADIKAEGGELCLGRMEF